MAGWQVGTGGVHAVAATNATAYGLFICDDTDAGNSTAITLDAMGIFDGDDLQGDAVVLQFYRNNVATSSTQAGGLVLEINFKNDGSVADGAISRAATGGSDSVPLITCGLKTSGTTINEALAAIEKALTEAVAQGDISNISVDNTGTTLLIYNLQQGSAATDILAINDKQTAVDQFRATGVQPASTSTGATNISLANSGAGGTVGAAAATTAISNGSLAAIFYCAKGSLTLHGNLAAASAGAGAEKTLAGSLVENVADKLEFRMKIFDESDAQVDDIVFNFKRNSSKYIRNVFNTNPQLTNSDTIEAADLKTYWLGESFVDHLDTNVDLDAADGAAFGILLPLGIDDTAEKNWGYHRYAAREAKSGWVFSDRDTNEQKLFRFKSMHVGEEIQRNYLIAIEQITAPQNSSVNAYGSFTVCIKDVAGNTVERYTGCDLNPASPNYVAARIGDQYQEWSDIR